jgi:hypothetical protein
MHPDVPGEQTADWGAAAARDRRPGAVDELREAADGLHYELDMLVEQLQPILRSEEPAPSQVLDMPGPLTELELLNQRIRAAVGRISNIRVRSSV